MPKKSNNNYNFLKSLFYPLTACLYVLATYNDWDNYLNERPLKAGLTYQVTFGGRMKFLTFINMVILILKSFLTFVNVVNFKIARINRISYTIFDHNICILA